MIRSMLRSGHAVLAAVACAIGGSVWLWRATFVPMLHDPRPGEAGPPVEYLLVAAPVWQALLLAAVAFAVLAGAHALLSRLLFHERPARFTAADVAYFHPLALFAFSLLALLALARPTRGWLFPWSYLAIDLRPWLAGFILVLFAIELDARSSGALRSRLAGVRSRLLGHSLALEAAMVAIAAAFVCVSSPIMRFNPALHGDEPRYIRYCENWYQGGGFDVSGVKYVADLPVDYWPRVFHNVNLLAGTIPEVARDLLADARRLAAGGFRQRFNRAKYLGGWFVEGKHGGVYQVHTPGVSLLVFPGYFVDRYLLNWTYGDPQVPRELFASTTSTLALYLVYGIAIFRFLRDYDGHVHRSWILALLTMLTLPLANFPFQFYPEVAAGIAIVLVSRYVLFSETASVGAGFMYGAVAGYIPWFQVRYLAVVALLLVGALVAGRRRPRAAVAFVIGWSLALGSLCLFVYHVTGSLLPTGLYYVRGDVLNFRAVGPGLFGFLFDGTFGVVAQAPILMLALMGLPRLVARRPAVALFCGLAMLLTAATAAAQTFTGALTTPGRYVVAVLPFATIGLTEALETFKESKAFKIVFALLAIVSVQTAWVYNLHHEKAVAQMVDTSFSGWKINLLFPAIEGFSWREKGFSSFTLEFWVFVYGALILLSLDYLRGRSKPLAETRTRQLSYSMLLLLALAAWGSFGSIGSAFVGRSFEPTYLMPPKQAAVESVNAAMGQRNVFAVSSTRGRVTRRALLDRPIQSFALTVMPSLPQEGQAAHFIVWPNAGDQPGGWGTLELDFGDGHTSAGQVIVANTEIQHTYDSAGYYEATGHLVTGLQNVTQRTVVAVARRTEDRAGGNSSIRIGDIGGLPADVATASAALNLRRVTIARDAVCVDVADEILTPPARLWIARRTSESWRAQMYELRGDRCAAIAGADAAARGQFAAMFVAAGTGSAMRRSDIVVSYWPDRAAILDEPLIVSSAARR